MDQEKDDTIVQDSDSVHPPSDILKFYSLSSDDDTSSGEIADNNATEADLHTQIVPRNMCPNNGPRQSDAGTGVPGFKPNNNGQTYKTKKIQ